MGLRQDILDHPVSELPLRPLITITPQSAVREAVTAMRANRVGCTVVVDDAGRPLGKFTERQLLRVLAENPEGLDLAISPYLVSTWACVTIREPIAKVIERLLAGGERFVVVTDETGKAVGITGQRGVMAYVAENFPRQVKVQLMEPTLFMEQREGA